MIRSLSLFFLGGSLLIMGSCNQEDKTLAAARTQFFDLSGMDSTVRPADNFFLFANGKWMQATVIPDDQSGWGSFYTLYNENLERMHGILKKSAESKAEKGSLDQKVGDYFSSGMDTMAIDKLGASPLKPWLARIDAIKDHKELMNLVAEAYTTGDGTLMGFYVGADDRNSTRNIAAFYQSGLNLPEKDYYTRQDSATKASRKAYGDYITRLFMLTGTDSTTAAANASTILALETEIAKSHKTPAETRNPLENYNKKAVSDLQKEMPNINWEGFFAKLNVKTDSVNLAQPRYFTALNTLLASQPIEAWKTKLKFEYISGNSGLLSKDFRDAAFEFNKTFSGQKVQSDRWKQMVNNVDNGLGELLGQLYVKEYFNETAKQRMDELVNNLQKAFAARITKLDWMSDSTKQRATAKLNTFLKKIGYPTKWKNFDDVNIDRNNYFGNAKAVAVHKQKEMINKIGKEVDRHEWMMSPPTVNAYYNPSNNEIVFPAGILQFPFFDPNADDAINYGGIGMVIGHEMTHGFDDQGSQYDDKGNMVNWWNEQDRKSFQSKTAGVVAQYSSYKMFDSIPVNGELTLGENIADIGGLAIAYDAFKMTEQGKSNEKVDGFTPDQRFFLGFAQVWRLKNRDEFMRMRLNIDPHSPEIFRVNGPLSNFDPFYAAFNVKEGDAMYLAPEKRAKIW